METTRNELPPVSWDDLLSAISPQLGFANADLRRAIGAVSTARQEGRITDEQAGELIKMLAAVAVSRQVNDLVGDFFTPDAHGQLGTRFGSGRNSRHGHRFSLI